MYMCEPYMHHLRRSCKVIYTPMQACMYGMYDKSRMGKNIQMYVWMCAFTYVGMYVCKPTYVHVSQLKAEMYVCIKCMCM